MASRRGYSRSLISSSPARAQDEAQEAQEEEEQDAALLEVPQHLQEEDGQQGPQVLLENLAYGDA